MCLSIFTLVIFSQKIMKKLIVVSSLMIVFIQAKSQEISFGARAGITRSSMVQHFADFANTDAITGLTGGVYLKAKFLGFFVMPELVYNQRGNDIHNVGSNTIHYIDVPLLAGKQFFKIFRINGGPVLQYALASNQLNNSLYTNNSTANSFVVGLQAGVGIDILKFSFDIRYDTNISESGTINMVSKTGTLPNYNYSSRASMWQFTIGYRFIKI
jgi:Outer membrane protein beta-barrel domain